MTRLLQVYLKPTKRDQRGSHPYTGREQVFRKQNVSSHTYHDIQALMNTAEPETQSSSTSSPDNVQICTEQRVNR